MEYQLTDISVKIYTVNIMGSSRFINLNQRLLSVISFGQISVISYLLNPTDMPSLLNNNIFTPSCID